MNDYQRYLRHQKQLVSLNNLINDKANITSQSVGQSNENLKISTLKPIYKPNNKENKILSDNFRTAINNMKKSNRYIAKNTVLEPSLEDGQIDIGSNQDNLNADKVNISNFDEIDYLTELRVKLNDVISNSQVVENLINLFDNLDIEYVKEMTNNFDKYLRIINKIPQPVNFQRLADVLKASIDEEFNKRGILDKVNKDLNVAQNAQQSIQDLYDFMFKPNGNLNDEFELKEIIKGLFIKFTNNRTINNNAIRKLF